MNKASLCHLLVLWPVMPIRTGETTLKFILVQLALKGNLIFDSEQRDSYFSVCKLLPVISGPLKSLFSIYLFLSPMLTLVKFSQAPLYDLYVNKVHVFSLPSMAYSHVSLNPLAPISFTNFQGAGQFRSISLLLASCISMLTPL